MTPDHSKEAIFRAPYIAGGRFAMEIHPVEVMDTSHVHGHIELNYMMDCQGTYLINGEQVAVKEQELILFWANTPHQMIAAEGKGQMLNIYIPFPTFMSWPLPDRLRKSLLSNSVIKAPASLTLTLKQIQQWLKDFQSENPAFRELMLEELSLLFKRIGLMQWKTLNSSPSTGQKASTTQGNHHVAEMVRFIGENLQNPISSRQVAGHLNLHRNYVINLFSKVMGCSIKQYIQHQRLMRAQSMLLDSNQSITDIAYASGFTTLKRLYDAFHRYYGMAPGQFRKLMQKPQP